MKKHILLIIFCIFLLVLNISISYAYKSDTDKPVHQYITNESQDVWKLIPFEIKDHIKNDIYTDDSFSERNYKSGDDIIDGSSEEDVPVTRAFSHFWESDNPEDGEYDDGLNIWRFNQQSSYRRALEFWNNRVIPLYLKGKIDESYYWLGRVVHLLEDATVPEHMHLDCHVGKSGFNWVAGCGGSSGDNGADDSSLEEYTGDIDLLEQNYKGLSYEGDQYNYESLPNMDNFDWSNVEPDDDQVSGVGNKELFDLFWYTAQKTQYFASDDVDGNDQYRYTDNTLRDFSSDDGIDMWSGDGVTIISDHNDLADDDVNNQGTDLENVADAVIPHAMKATAGLFRLFWDAVAIDWPFYHHDLRRTGFTLLKGDLSKSDDEQSSWTLDSAVDPGAFDFPSIADIDGDGKMEILTATSITQGGSSTNWEGRFYVLNCKESNNKCRDFTEKWKFYKNDFIIGKAPSIDDINDDGIKEVVFAGFPYGSANDGTVYAFKANKKGKLDEGDARYKYNLPYEADQHSGDSDYGEIGQTAIADIDNDGKKEILIADYSGLKNWQGHLYILEPGSGHNFDLQQNIDIGPYAVSGGAKGAIAIANIDSDDYPEIIVPDSFGIYVYEYDGNNVVKKWNNSDAFIYHTAVVADVDADNDYEIIYTTTDDPAFCPTGVTCTEKLHIVDALTGTEECSIALPQIPISDPAVGNLNSDNKLEIALVTRNSAGSESSTGSIRTYDYNCNALNTYSPGDTYHSAPDIFDIDNNGNNNVIFAGRNGTLYVLENNLAYKWDYDLGGEIASAPAIGDLDGDGKAEIAAKRFTSLSQSMMSSLGKTFVTEISASEIFMLGGIDSVINVIEGNNTQPVLDEIDDIYGIEGDLINLTVTSTEYDLDTLTYSYSNPLNESGDWQTDENSSGTYEILAEVSDGNLTDSQFFTLTIYENGTELENNFSDGDNFKELNFSVAGSQTINLNLNKKIDLERAALKIKGNSLDVEANSYQEPTLSIIEANELDSTYPSTQSTDKDWNTYYSAGKATGEIVEIQNLDIPANINHILFHLKMRVYGGGYGRFAVYNYNTQEYEIVTSSIPSFTDESKEVYFDVYEDNPLFLENNTAFIFKVSNINNYIDSTTNSTRWYYRYLGDWASQKVYESEVKFESDLIYPTDLKLDIGSDGTDDIEYDGELHSNYIKVDSLSNGNKNETISINGDSTTRYIKLPKDADISKAEISVGEKTIETLEANEIKNLQNNDIILPKEVKGENFNAYLNDDSTYTASLYTRPINYLDNGIYKPINTEIKPSNTEYDYEVTEGIYKAYFKDSEIKIEKDNTYLTFKPLTKGTILNVNGNQITYRISDDVNLRYTYENGRLKEEIILNKKPSFNEIGFEIDTNGLVNNSKDILNNKGDKTFSISNLYAFDANNYKENLNYQINNNILTIQLPQNWMDNAIYPVIIDPSFTTISSSASSYIEEENPDVNNGGLSYLDHQTRNSNRNMRIVLKFSLSGIPSGSEIINSNLFMYCKGYYQPQSGKTDTDIWEISTGWTENDVTWNDGPSWENYINSSYCDTQNVWHNWDVTADTIEEYEKDQLIGFGAQSQTESYDSTARYTEYNDNAFLNITYLPNEAPTLVGCSDDYTTRNSDGSDISVDLWDCHYDEDNSADESTFSIISESNTTLIDCSITSDRYVTCGSPDTNAIGYSDVMAQVSDSQYTDNDTLRIYIKPTGNATVSINGTEIFHNNYYAPRDLDVKLEIENYLDVCEEDSNGDCLVPIEIEGDDIFDFNINSINIQYKLNELDFKDALQNYLDNTCTTDNCLIPLEFTLSSEGKLNLTELEIFYTLDTDKFIINNPSGTNVAYFDNLGNLKLKGSCTASANCIPPSDSFIIKGAGYDTVAYIDKNGNLCIEDSDCGDNDNSCEDTRTPDSFIIENGNNVVAYVNKTGGLCLEGSLTESWTP